MLSLMFTVAKHPSIRVILVRKGNTPIKTSGRCITQLAKMSIDANLIELTADVLIPFNKNRRVQVLKGTFGTSRRVKGQKELTK